MTDDLRNDETSADTGISARHTTVATGHAISPTESPLPAPRDRRPVDEDLKGEQVDLDEVNRLDPVLSLRSQLENFDVSMDRQGGGKRNNWPGTPALEGPREHVHGQISPIADHADRNPVGSEGPFQNQSTPDLRERSSTSRLQDENNRLRRLVVAQKAAIEAERQSHQKTREAAARAIAMALSEKAGHPNDVVVKIARRDSKLRLRLEHATPHLSNQLDNALSTIRNEDAETPDSLG